MAHWNGLDLNAALGLLRHAGVPDPLQAAGSQTSQLQRLIDALCDLSMHDGLTGLVNATFFRSILARELDRSARTGRRCALMLLDLDHFKTINDTYGHSAGDLVLRQFSQKLRTVIRSMDTAGRIGGEEFAVILPECNPTEAVQAGQRLHAEISPLVLRIDEHTLEVTTSVGLAWTKVNTSQDATGLLALADEELYRAKDLGRHRLCHPVITPTHVLPEERASLLFASAEEDQHEN